MSGNEIDLLNPANAYFRFRSSRNGTSNPTVEEIAAPGRPQQTFTDRTRRSSDSYDSADDEGDGWSKDTSSTFSDTQKSSGETFDAANGRHDDDSPDLSGIAEGQRLVIAVDYGTTFTGI